MLTKRIIPCLDVTEGRVVKGTNFVNLKDAGDPIELAKRYNDEGADELVFLDITASSDKRNILINLVEATAQEVFIPFTVGGGINDVDMVRDLLLAGADKVSINTAAIKDPSLIESASRHFGSQCIVVAIDARRIQSYPPTELKYNVNKDLACDAYSHWEIYTHGGRNPSGIDAIKWAQYMAQLGAGELLVTSMDADGTKNGYDLALTKTINQQVSIPVIASGGAGNSQHIIDVLGVSDAALLASLLHYRELTISKIKFDCNEAQIPIRQID
ncbi:MAG: imidazole glycerol phosphate synthase subunit HisF [Actinobacteria bacterium]|nr:imidazole glycerol phosphate synthase subunit HisF [Actinomycetota bacterium]